MHAAAGGIGGAWAVARPVRYKTESTKTEDMIRIHRICFLR